MNVKKIILIFFIIICIFTCISIFYIFIINKNYIISTGGEFETAYVTWNDLKGISYYNVYIKNIEEDNYKKLDNELIRKYKIDNNQFWRADALGLKEGTYQFKIVPVFNKKEYEEFSITTTEISVKANVREGFSFSKKSINGGKSSGGYLEDGRVPEDAKIIYVNKDNINSVELEISNSNGNIIKAIGISEILANWKEEAYSKHLIIRLLGKIDKENVKGLNQEYQSIEINNIQGVTLEGIGNDATLDGIGVLIQNSSNIEVRNLGIMLFYEDAISLNNNYNIWIHNNDIFYGQNREYEERDKKKGDGSTDIRLSKYITISYNHYWDSGKTSLCGVEENINYITYHHNWFDHSDSRCPRIRYASVHIYNNYYDEISLYVIGASDNASVFVEANYFQNCKHPMLISEQGSDFKKHTLSNEPGGMIKAYNNTFEQNKIMLNIVYTNENSTQFDAYLAKSRNEKVPEKYKTLLGNNVYNNFDTDSEIMYDYVPDKPKKINEIVTSMAGRVQRGDIKFDSNELNCFSSNREDKKEKELDELLNSYETSLVYVQMSK